MHFIFYNIFFLFQILEVKSPINQNKTDKQMKNGDCDKVNNNEVAIKYYTNMFTKCQPLLQNENLSMSLDSFRCRSFSVFFLGFFYLLPYFEIFFSFFSIR